jgi:2-succinyl-5-enolpyruvyl-6-hydroxy-3-cyclohexene-1-carboxylate synthase
MIGDPFTSLTETVNCRPEEYLNGMKFNSAEYRDYFVESERNLIGTEFNYFTAVEKITADLPEKSVLHLGNGMPVRIIDFIGLKKDVDVFCNRGTSGIDGVVSSAVGHALADSRMHTLIIGDLSFFYDRNGLWLNHEFPTNLRIVILNDGGGGIFNMISGPADQGELTKLFTVPHNRTAELTADEFGLEYKSARSEDELIGFKKGILEIFTDMETNRKVFKSF